MTCHVTNRSRPFVPLPSHHVYGFTQITFYQRTRKVDTVIRPAKLISDPGNSSTQCRSPRTSPTPTLGPLRTIRRVKRGIPTLPFQKIKSAHQPCNRRTKTMRHAPQPPPLRLVVRRYNGRPRHRRPKQRRPQHANRKHTRCPCLRTSISSLVQSRSHRLAPPSTTPPLRPQQLADPRQRHAHRPTSPTLKPRPSTHTEHDTSPEPSPTPTHARPAPHQQRARLPPTPPPPRRPTPDGASRPSTLRLLRDQPRLAQLRHRV